MKNSPISLILLSMLLSSCNPQKAKTNASDKKENISVAEWSLHRSIKSGEIDHLDFPRIVKDSFKLSHIEYVSQFFQDKAEDYTYLNQMKDSCEKHGVTNLLIMIDGEGELGNINESERKKSVENHKKWVKAASYLNCKAIRVNGNGIGNLNEIKSALVKSLNELSTYAATMNITIVVENHGMMIPGKGWSNYAPSTNGKWLAQVLKKVNSTNCLALPDFGNFDKYDRYQGMKDLMPYAFGVSAKTFVFNQNGEDTQTDFKKVFDIIRAHEFDGFIGIEFEGPTDSITEYEGIQKTLDLIRKYY